MLEEIKKVAVQTRAQEKRSWQHDLNFSSKHSKDVKNRIAMSCLMSSRTKLCLHKINATFNAQATCLLEVGYPCVAVAPVAQRL